jgi:hypothetical protein
MIKHWRCDLTALSHLYNIYFVACTEEIYVYCPSFPFQDLGDPVRILEIPRSQLPTPPGIDFEHTHSVTRICVDYLGNAEVLLATCDDGDVVGWRVADIVSLAESCSADPPSLVATNCLRTVRSSMREIPRTKMSIRTRRQILFSSSTSTLVAAPGTYSRS